MQRRTGRQLSAIFIALLLVVTALSAQTLYKYRGQDGEWIYTDRKPVAEDGGEVEERKLTSEAGPGGVSVTRHSENGRHTLLARNSLHAPVQLRLMAQGRAAGERHREWVLEPQSSVELMTLSGPTEGEQRYMWLVGDPEAVHQPQQAYRAPFPAAVSHRISQAWPETVTHNTPDSMHAVDIAMPIGSNVHAAREGIVVEVASTNYTNTTTTAGSDGSRANVVRILHDDGTFAIYAHLNWNSIRVRPGQRVERGEYIANSGNTGFSTGPHLHFVVVRNAGMRMVSMPVSFALPLDEQVIPRSGELLTAH